MSRSRDDDAVTGISPRSPSTAERWQQYQDMQQLEEEYIGNEPALRQLDDIHILEKASAPVVGQQLATHNNQAIRTNPEVAAFMGEDGFDHDSYTAPIEESSTKGDAAESQEQAFKFRNPFMRDK